MKVLQVNCVFQKGSTGKIVNDIHISLQNQGIESVVCYGRGSAKPQANVYHICNDFIGRARKMMCMLGAFQYGGMWLTTHYLKHIILKEKPDVVHLHCINGFFLNIYSLLKFLAEENIKTLVTHHAEFFYTGSCGHAYECNKWQNQKGGCGGCPILPEATYCKIGKDNTAKAWKKMKDAFDAFKPDNLLFTAVSPWVKTRSMLSPIVNKFDCEVVMNGLETDIFKPTELSAPVKVRLDEAGIDKYCLFVSASFSPNKNSFKGGYYIIELAKRMPEKKFVIVATYSSGTEELPENVYFWGRTNDQRELAQLYSNADVSLIASPRETFSMVTAETLCCGTPIVGFKAGGPESIAIEKFSKFVEYGNITALQEAIENLSSFTCDKQILSYQAQKLYSKEAMTKNYLILYLKLQTQ